MNKDEASVIPSNKPKYEAPVVLDLAQMGGAQGACSEGSSDDSCMIGAAAGVLCASGTVGFMPGP